MLSPTLPEPRGATSSTIHPLGLTPLGAELTLTLLLAAGRAHAFAGIAVVVALSIAVPLGLAAGTRSGRLLSDVELWVGRLLDSVGVFVLIAAVLAMFPGLSVLRVAVLLGMILCTAFVGIVRHAVIEVRYQAYYEAAIAAGLPSRHLVLYYFVPVIWRRIAPQALGVAALLVGALGAVDFMGLGVKREISVGYLL